jgi:hypothetical protein
VFRSGYFGKAGDAQNKKLIIDIVSKEAISEAITFSRINFLFNSACLRRD